MSIASRLARDGVPGEPVPAGVPGEFVVDLLEDTGMMERGEAERCNWLAIECRGRAEHENTVLGWEERRLDLLG